MALSDFHNGYTSGSLYSRYSLSLHSVRVAQKDVVSTKKNISRRSYVAHQNYVTHKKICSGNKKNISYQKRDSCCLNMFSVAQKKNSC